MVKYCQVIRVIAHTQVCAFYILNSTPKRLNISSLYFSYMYMAYKPSICMKTKYENFSCMYFTYKWIICIKN